jgi:hypothetical protein
MLLRATPAGALSAWPYRGVRVKTGSTASRKPYRRAPSQKCIVPSGAGVCQPQRRDVPTKGRGQVYPCRGDACVARTPSAGLEPPEGGIGLRGPQVHRSAPESPPRTSVARLGFVSHISLPRTGSLPQPARTASVLPRPSLSESARIPVLPGAYLPPAPARIGRRPDCLRFAPAEIGFVLRKSAGISSLTRNSGSQTRLIAMGAPP